MLHTLTGFSTCFPAHGHARLSDLFGHSAHWHCVVGLQLASNVQVDALVVNPLGEVFVVTAAHKLSQKCEIIREVEALFREVSPAHSVTVSFISFGAGVSSPLGVATVEQLGELIASTTQAPHAYGKLAVMPDSEFSALLPKVLARHIAQRVTDEKENSDEFKSYNCAQCGTGVNANIAHWCRVRVEKFKGKVYCAPCQGSVA